MRPLFELLIIGLVIFAGWHQPFKDHAAALFPDSGIEPSRTAILAQRSGRYEGRLIESPAPEKKLQKNPSWMWKETSMDRPYQSHGNVNH